MTLEKSALKIFAACGFALMMATVPAFASTNAGYSYHSHVRKVSKQSAVKYFRRHKVANNKSYRIGVVLQSGQPERRKRLRRGLQKRATKLGVTLLFAGQSAAGDPQVARAKRLADKHLDAYIVAPLSGGNLAPALKQMRRQNVPVVNLGTKRVAATAYIGPDYRDQGRTAASKLHAQLTSTSRIKKLFFSQRVKVAQIRGDLGNAHVIERIRGFDEGVGRWDALEKVDTVPGGSSPQSAYAAAERLIRENPDLQGIFAGDNDMALGAAQSAQSASKAIAVVGVGASPELLSALRQDGLVATISSMPYYQGVWALDATVRLLQGHGVPTWLTAPSQLLTPGNVHIYYGQDNKTQPNLYRK